jgi:release factor glutamine methyltransferase
LPAAIDWGTRELHDSSDTATLDAELLLAELLQYSRAQLIAHSERFLTGAELAHYQHFVSRRKQGEPLAYIVGHKEFWSLDLRVTPATLVPRPETELLVELALQLFPQEGQPRRVADLGAGSGAVALALSQERPAWEMYATDRLPAALEVARQNAANLGLGRVQFLEGSWCAALPALPFDAILSNPPYLSETEWQASQKELRFEPASALVAGEDGLQDLTEILRGAKKCLRSGGYLLLEHGWEQGLALRQCFEKEGYQEIRSYHDLAGRERVSGGRWTI